jgi:hypothetical protein
MQKCLFLVLLRVLGEKRKLMEHTERMKKSMFSVNSVVRYFT